MEDVATAVALIVIKLENANGLDKIDDVAEYDADSDDDAQLELLELLAHVAETAVVELIELLAKLAFNEFVAQRDCDENTA